MFEWLFKYPRPVFENGDFVFLNGWPVALLVACTAALALLWAVQLARSTVRLGRVRGTVVWLLQSALAALVLVLLWRPAVQIAVSRPQQNVVAVLVDTSQSMKLDDPGSGPRIEAARRAVAERLLPGLEPRFRVRLYSFADRPEPIDRASGLASEGATTRLRESLAAVVRESRVLPLAAVVVLTDGADNASVESGTAAFAAPGIPIHTIGIGRPELARDVELQDVAVPVRAPAGSRLKVTARLRHRGFAGRKVRLAVHEGGRALATRDVVLARGQDRQTEDLFLAVGESGARTLVVSVDALEEEEVTSNNRLARPLHVVPRRGRVLYVEGEPRWELKFIRRAAAEDPSLQLVSLLRTSGNKVYRQGVEDEKMLAEGFPTRAEDLFAFDALVIGSVEATFFTPAQLELLRDFAGRRGGSILFLGGRRSLGDGGFGASPIADILPVHLPSRTPSFVRRPAKAELTAEGRDSLLCLLDEDPAKNAARWAALPELADHQLTGELKPGASLLAQARVEGGRALPLLALQSYGRGQTLVFATGGSWRWRMQLPSQDTSHATFWRQLLRSLVASAAPPLVVSADRSLYADDDRVTVRAEVRTRAYEAAADARAWATVVAENGDRETFELAPAPAQRGLYEGRLSVPGTGRHRIEVHASRGEEDLGREAIVVYREDGVAEGFHPEQNRALLQEVAQASGGRYWTLDELDGLPNEIAYSGTGITMRETLELWDMPAVFATLLALRASEWLVRRGAGRV